MIRVLLVEDQTMMRDALGALLGLEPDIEVVGAVGNGDEGLHTAERLRPDVALIDIELPGLDGLTLAERLAGTVPGCRAVIVTTFGRPGYLRRAMAANVAGFVLKETPAAEVASAVRKVHAGERVNPKQAEHATGLGRVAFVGVRDARSETQRARRQHAFGLRILAMPLFNGFVQLCLLLRRENRAGVSPDFHLRVPATFEHRLGGIAENLGLPMFLQRQARHRDEDRRARSWKAHRVPRQLRALPPAPSGADGEDGHRLRAAAGVDRAHAGIHPPQHRRTENKAGQVAAQDAGEAR